MKIYELVHMHGAETLADGRFHYGDCAMLGCFSSAERVAAAIEKYRSIPGFCDYPNGFVVFAHEVEEHAVLRFEKLPMFRGIQSAPVRSAIVSAFIIILSMSISMAGLTNIIKYGYGYCGYLGIAVVVVPFLTVGVYKNRKYIREHGLAQGFAAVQPEAEAAEEAASAAIPAEAK